LTLLIAVASVPMGVGGKGPNSLYTQPRIHAGLFVKQCGDWVAPKPRVAEPADRDSEAEEVAEANRERTVLLKWISFCAYTLRFLEGAAAVADEDEPVRLLLRPLFPPPALLFPFDEAALPGLTGSRSLSLVADESFSDDADRRPPLLRKLAPRRGGPVEEATALVEFTLLLLLERISCPNVDGLLLDSDDELPFTAAAAAAGGADPPDGEEEAAAAIAVTGRSFV